MAADMMRVRVQLTGGPGGPQVCTHYFGLGGIGDGTAAQAVTAVGTFWGALDNQMTGGYTWTTGTEVENMDRHTGQVESITAVTAQTGSALLGTDVLPWESQAVIRWRTGVFYGGRELRGRTFVPGQAEGNSTAGVPTAALIAAYNTAAAALAADANSTLLVYSPTKHVADPAIVGDTWNTWGGLRSRRS